MADDPGVSDQEILAAFVNVEEPELFPWELADVLPIPADLAGDRLDDLAERGLLVREAEGTETAYRLASGVADEMTIPDEAVETDVEAQASRVAGVESTAREAETPASPPPEPGEAPPGPEWRPPEDAIEALDLPGNPAQTEQRREAVRRAYDYLREHGTADRATFESEVFPEAPGAYEDPDDGWWERAVRPGLQQLPGVVAPASEDDEWRFAGESE